MGASSTRKGARAERELAGEFRDNGFPLARRTAMMQAQEAAPEADVFVAPGLVVEGKRQERLEIPMWLRQLQAHTPAGDIGVLCFRRSRQPWRAVLTARDLRMIVPDAPRVTYVRDRWRLELWCAEAAREHPSGAVVEFGTTDETLWGCLPLSDLFVPLHAHLDPGDTLAA